MLHQSRRAKTFRVHPKNIDILTVHLWPPCETQRCPPVDRTNSGFIGPRVGRLRRRVLWCWGAPSPHRSDIANAALVFFFFCLIILAFSLSRLWRYAALIPLPTRSKISCHHFNMAPNDKKRKQDQEERREAYMTVSVFLPNPMIVKHFRSTDMNGLVSEERQAESDDFHKLHPSRSSGRFDRVD